MSNQSPATRFLSTLLLVVLGVFLGISTSAGMLILEPVRISRKVPTEEDKQGEIYYVAGTRIGSKGAQWLSKKQAFEEGRSGELSLVEEELNQWMRASYESRKSRLELPAINMEVRADLPVFRIADGVLQVGMPVEYSSFGKRWKIYTQVQGGFEKEGNVFSFVPERLYVGSCPVPNTQGISRFFFYRYKNSFEIPEDLQNAWANLADVRVEGNTLLLTP